jgi:hypothetical protein
MFKKLILATLMMGLSLQPALADCGRHDHDRGHGYDRGHSYNHRPAARSSVSFNFGTSPYYYSHYRPYRPVRVIYQEVPAVAQPQVIYINNENSRVVTGADGRYCREYQSEIRVGGRLERTYGTACQEQDGSWEIVS